MIFTFVNIVNVLIYLPVVIYAHVLSLIFPKRNHYVLRLIGSVILGGVAVYFLPFVATGNFVTTLLYAVFMYVFLLGVSLGSVAFCVRGNLINYFSCAACGYALQHLSSNISGIIATFAPELNLDENCRFGAIALTVGTFLISLAITVYIAVRNQGLRAVMNRRRVAFITVFVVMVDIVLSSALMLAPMFGFQAFADSAPKIYATATSLLIVFGILILLKQQKLEAEVLAMNVLYEENVRQYEVSKATMASLHDLKHRINALMEGRLDLPKEERNEIARSIFFMDSRAKSGNETLDIILTEKKMLCYQFGIEFNSMVDGSKLSFIDTYDIFSLFGNSLSNAIEAANRLPEGKARYISLIVKGTDHFVSIHLENSYEGEIHMEEGIPVTVKDDPFSHGFGVKSIRGITEKYGGNVTISFEQGIFNLDIFFPRD